MQTPSTPVHVSSSFIGASVATLISPLKWDSKYASRVWEVYMFLFYFSRLSNMVSLVYGCTTFWMAQRGNSRTIMRLHLYYPACLARALHTYQVLVSHR